MKTVRQGDSLVNRVSTQPSNTGVSERVEISGPPQFHRAGEGLEKSRRLRQVEGEVLRYGAPERAGAAELKGKFVREDGSYLVGSEIVAGTWQTTRDRIEDCYWEVSDTQGNIIANNFISVAPQLTIDIPANAAGFTTERCGTWRWVS